MTREANSKAEQSNTPEQQKKLQDKVEKCKQDVQKVRATTLLWAHEALGEENQWKWPPPFAHFIPIFPSLRCCRRVRTCRQCSGKHDRVRDLPLLLGQNLSSNQTAFTPQRLLA